MGGIQAFNLSVGPVRGTIVYVLLVGGMVARDLKHGHRRKSSLRVRNGRQVELFGFRLEIVPFCGAKFGNEAAGHGWVLRKNPA